jgi:hypothetical protein
MYKFTTHDHRRTTRTESSLVMLLLPLLRLLVTTHTGTLRVLFRLSYKRWNPTSEGKGGEARRASSATVAHSLHIVITSRIGRLRHNTISSQSRSTDISRTRPISRQLAQTNYSSAELSQFPISSSFQLNLPL